MAVFSAPARVVVKIGTNSIAHPKGGLQRGRMHRIAADLAWLRSQGIHPIIVSSGAVGLGMDSLKLGKRPAELSSLQALAAIGQSQLMQEWQQALAANGLKASQILLTRDAVRGRKRHVAIKNTLEQLITYGAIPIINENDTVSADEIKFGDNDVLSALTASLIKAELLIILSTIPGLMDLENGGTVIPVVEEIDEQIKKLAQGPQDQRSTGGMITKIEAAEIATRSGCRVVIGDAADSDLIKDVVSQTGKGTHFLPSTDLIRSKMRWIAFFQNSKGSVILDDGAINAVSKSQASLLARGVKNCTGNFEKGDVVELQSEDGKPIGKGVAEFSCHELSQVCGKSNEEIKSYFPDRKRCEVVHKDSLYTFSSKK